MRLFVCVALLQSSPWALLVSIIASQVTASQPLSYSTHVFAHVLGGLALHPNDFIPWIWLTTCLFFFFCLWFWMFIINLYKSSSGNCCFFPLFSFSLPSLLSSHAYKNNRYLIMVALLWNEKMASLHPAELKVCHSLCYIGKYAILDKSTMNATASLRRVAFNINTLSYVFI